MVPSFKSQAGLSISEPEVVERIPIVILSTARPGISIEAKCEAKIPEDFNVVCIRCVSELKGPCSISFTNALEVDCGETFPHHVPHLPSFTPVPTFCAAYS